MPRCVLVTLFTCLSFAASTGLAIAQTPATPKAGLFDRSNLMAWCIVPFDAKKRGPEARAEMLARMGIFKFAYDWRAEHIPTFDEEIETLQRWGIELSAFWFPGALNDDAKAILAALERHHVRTELWVTMDGGSIECAPEEQEQRVRDHAAALRPIVDAAAAIGCKVGLYNHGGWFGEPENEIAILKALNADNVGLVYNQHHGHGHVERFAELLDTMLPYLYCLNLNGMVPHGDETGKLILPIGTGSLDLELLRIVNDSGYSGPIGILNHTDLDAEKVLLDNLDGLEWLVPQLDGSPPSGPRPPLRTDQGEAMGVASRSDALRKALSGSTVEMGNDAYRTPPITVSCWARLDSATGYNILVASDTKTSGAHWEIFTEVGSGALSVYTPGRAPDHVRSGRVVTDGAWHHVGMQHETDGIRLFLDGVEIAYQSSASTGAKTVAGGLAIGRLVEGAFFCDGAIDDVHIQRGIQSMDASGAPAKNGGTTLGLWDFNALPLETARSSPTLEDPNRRAALPEFQTIPAAAPATLTPALPVSTDTYSRWRRSHGGTHNARYSNAASINRETVHRLTKAWEFHSEDGPANVQCNPIVAEGLLIAPTSGGSIVALDATCGVERWRFKTGGRPALRGLTYVAGEGQTPSRVLFPAEDGLYALDTATGTPISSFGKNGRIPCGPSVVAPAVYQELIVTAGLVGDVWAFDRYTGERRWTFKTIPTGDELGHDTWDTPEEGANCWGGFVLDEARGLVYVSTGSPKPNFAGNTHTGQNLFANCVLALDAKTGAYRWHFQEIRHDIWDLDIPAPPVLVSLDRGGRRVDAVAQVTKIGNTLLLDRVTGQPLFPFRLRRAPVSPLPGERTWPYQPDVQLPEPFARQMFSLDDVTTRSDLARETVMQRLANARHGWFEPFEENVPTALYGFHGGAEWTGAAYDPESDRLYVSANNIPWLVTVFRPDPPAAETGRGREVFEAHCAKCHGSNRFGVGMNPPLHGLARRLNDKDVRALLKTGRGAMPPAPPEVSAEDTDALLDFLFLRDAPKDGASNAPGPLRYTHNGYPKLVDDEGYPGVKPPWGTLNCLDLASGKLVWQVPLGVYPELAAWGEDDTGAENFGGPSVTAGGLVFCGGTPDNRIRAFDTESGDVLWEHGLPFGGYAPPTVYEVDGVEYIVIAATGGGKLDTPTGDAYVAFALEEE